MNWVGGSRNRLVMKNDAKKQREFFEKRKMQQKLKNLGVSRPTTSPADSSSGSMDLVTLFIVNQIAAKKNSEDPPKVGVLGSYKERSRRKSDQPLVLPMSPCPPSLLNLAESEPQYSAQGIRKRKNIDAHGFKCGQLSPVMESAFSDNSASDYVPPVPDPHSPFSSTSSASSGQGRFPLPLSLQKQNQTQLLPHYSPPPWDTSIIQQANFQPFSEPREMTDTVSRSGGTNPPLFHMQTPTTVQSLFRSPESDETQRRDYGSNFAAFPLNQPEDKEPMLDFILNQSESKQQFEDDVFGSFGHEEYEGEAPPFGNGESKFYLTVEKPSTTSTLQTVPDSQYMPAQLSNCTDVNVSCLGSDTGPVNGCESSPSYSCRGGYLSSDSDDEETCHPCLRASASYVDSAAGTVNTSSCSLGTPNVRGSQHRPCTPLRKPNSRDDGKITDEAHRNKGRPAESSPAQSSPPHPLLPPQASCKCKKTSPEVRDAQTQTARCPAAQTCDTSTQCSFVAAGESNYPWFGLYRPKADLLEQRLATGRQSDPTEQADAQESEGKPTPWRKEKSKSDATRSSSIIHKIAAKESGKVFVQRPTNPFLDAMIKTNHRERVEGRDESARQDKPLLMKDLSDGGTEGVTSVTGANTPSVETESLQEIADILLLLNQKKKE